MPPEELLPICFVVMPFGVKETGGLSPPRVDFDALWKMAIEPALGELGYRPVRADQDMGALIIKEMLERLYYSDLVVADVSIANANAYYEVGVRHAARPTGCVLIAADWSRPVFDLAQVRHIPYPHPDERVDEAEAEAIKQRLVAEIPKWAASKTPLLETIAGYPNAPSDGRRARELARQLEAFEQLRADLATIARMPEAQRETAASRLLASRPPARVQLGAVAVEIFKFLRDVVGDWKRSLEYIDALPEAIRKTPFMAEQRALAQSKDGDHWNAIAALEALVQTHGDSSERQGLLGGRYKRLYNESKKTGTPDSKLLHRAIDHYERGMKLDLNDYYPSCNLPALYRERGQQGDEERAKAAAAVARIACERARERSSDDPWLRPTLLGLALAERNAAAFREIAGEVEREGGAGWHLATTLEDADRHLEQTPDLDLRSQLSAVVLRLRSLSAQG
jgi:hypothetical protein